MGRRVRGTASPRPSTAPAAPTTAPMPLVAMLRHVDDHWRRSPAFTAQTRLRLAETVTRFAALLHSEQTGSFSMVTAAQAEQFIRAATRAGRAPELATMHARRTALRALYRTLRELGVADGDPTLDITLPPRGELAARPLTDDEIALARLAAYGHPQSWTAVRAVSWALAEATAVSSEVAAVRLTDLRHPPDAHGPVAVALPGTRRHDPRVVELSAWGRQVLARRAAELRAAGAPAHALLAYGGAAPPGGAKAQAAVCNALRVVLRDAGLAGEPDVRPSSVRHWAGRALYDAGAPIHEVARALGHRSLDETATDIGLRWRTSAPVATAVGDRRGEGR